MKAKGTIKFKLNAKVNGQEVTPENIGFGEFLNFTRDVGDFIRGSESPTVLDQVHIAFE